ncbi:GGDEF domain-containing protein [Vibrio scophthalmi]|uniref:GGDEF domain-containing protein n=1 Tax=Gammaproteobacteria TaxID=1236 RepID=UPI000D5910D9|nr:GGDEF domain-containing protein [Shewanella halifaxensis]
MKWFLSAIAMVLLAFLLVVLSLNSFKDKFHYLTDQIIASNQSIDNIHLLFSEKRRYDILILNDVQFNFFNARANISNMLDKELVKYKTYDANEADILAYKKLKIKIKNYNTYVNKAINYKYNTEQAHRLSLAMFDDIIKVISELKEINNSYITDFQSDTNEYIKEQLLIFLCIALIVIVNIFMLKSNLVKMIDLKRTAMTDVLTGCSNRKILDTYHNDEPFSVAIIDIDHFKQINDVYGHSCGDFILKGFSKLLSESFRKCDLIVRYGGEEFVVIMNDNSYSFEACERFRKRIEHNVFYWKDININITCSIGLFNHELFENKNIEYKIELADLALYEAKNNGRNKTCIYTTHD